MQETPALPARPRAETPLAPAEWLWPDGAFGPNETVEFAFEIETADPAACRLYVSVNSHYALYVNGAFADCDQFPDYPCYKVYDELPLGGLLRPGKNRLSLLCYCQGESSLTVRAYPAGAAFALYEGRVLLAASGADTPARRVLRYAADVEKITPQLSYSFAYDATLPETEFSPAPVLGYDWPLAPRPVEKVCIDPPHPSRVALTGRFQDTLAEGTPAQRMQAALLCTAAPFTPPELPCEKGADIDGNAAVIDLGAELTGYLLLDLELPEACDVYIGWGEHLEDLRVRTAISVRNFAGVWHAPAGRSTFFYPFKRLGLRYLQLHVYTGRFRLYYAGVRCARYPLGQALLFTCADRLHSQIYRTGLRTLQACMHDHYEDCPWREQALYAMDSRNQMLCGYYAFGEYAFARASLRMLALSLREDGTLELTSPGEADITIPSFTVIWLVQMAEYLRFSGDEAFAREMLPTVQAIAQGLLARIGPDGLLPRFAGAGYWNFYEWQTGLDGALRAESADDQAAEDAPLSAFASLGLAGAAELARTLGETAAADRYENAAKGLNRALDAAFWVPEKGCYATTRRQGALSHFCELTQALAVCCGAVPAERLPSVLTALAGGGPKLLPVTLSHSIFKYEALLRRPALYGRLVFGELAELYGAMLYRGATTFWETADGAAAFDNAGSLCHGWSAIPVYFYLRYCADSRGEGTALPPEVTGLYEPRVRRVPGASQRIQDDDWAGC